MRDLTFICAGLCLSAAIINGITGNYLIAIGMIALGTYNVIMGTKQ